MIAAEVPVLAFSSVTRTYGATPPVHALRDASFCVKRGEFVAIMGPSGSGKSTMLNLAALIDRPTSGDVRLDGLDVGTMGETARAALRAHRVGVVFQAFHLMPHRTALENVALAQLYRRVPRPRRLEAAGHALAAVGLAHRAHALPTTLSGGEQQRVAIARGLVNQPSLLLLDEPTGDLDSTTAEQILAVLERLSGRGLTLVMITHDASVAARAQRVATIRDGVLEDPSGDPC